MEFINFFLEILIAVLITLITMGIVATCITKSIIDITENNKYIQGVSFSILGIFVFTLFITLIFYSGG